jgi:tRNA(Ile)-lysidine synthase
VYPTLRFRRYDGTRIAWLQAEKQQKNLEMKSLSNRLNPDDPFVRAIGDNLEVDVVGLNQANLRALVALSGGPDSCALLAALAALKAELNLDLSAAHINHCLRGNESDEDEQFCRELCSELGIELHVEKMPVVSTHQSEAVLREVRYDLLFSIARNTHCSAVVTGHNKDDQVETMLFRMFRGTSPAGLRGMERVRQVELGLAILRPMLTQSRSEVESYLQRIELTPRIDSSNAGINYSRNYIRNELTPLIEARFPGFKQRIENLRSLIHEDEEWMETSAEEICSVESFNTAEDDWDLNKVRFLPAPICRRLLAQALRLRDIEASYQWIQLIRSFIEDGEGAASLDGVWDVKVADNQLRWIDKTADSAEPASTAEEILRIPGRNICLSLGCTIQIVECKILEPFPPSQSHEAIVDLSSVKSPLVVRHRRPGDVIRPFGMNQLVKLKKFLHTHKNEASPVGVRSCLVIADQDEVLWIPGFGLSNKVRVNGSPTHKLRLSLLAEDDTPFA